MIAIRANRKKILILLVMVILLVDILPEIISNIELRMEYTQVSRALLPLVACLQDEIPLHEIEENTLYQTLETISGFSKVDDSIPHTIKLSEDIRYYEEPGEGQEPAYILSAGTEIKWHDPGDSEGNMQKYYHTEGYWDNTYDRPYSAEEKAGLKHSSGYGLESFPTYEKGWRYVRPFVTAEETEMPGTYYYVRLKDLENVVYDLYAHLDLDMEKMSMPIETRVYVMTRRLDSQWYDSGIFLSKDIYKSVWHWWDTALLFLLVVLLVDKNTVTKVGRIM